MASQVTATLVWNGGSRLGRCTKADAAGPPTHPMVQQRSRWVTALYVGALRLASMRKETSKLELMPQEAPNGRKCVRVSCCHETSQGVLLSEKGDFNPKGEPTWKEISS